MFLCSFPLRVCRTNPLHTGNYDNVLNAMLVLFELCTEEAWPNTMIEAVDATSPGLQQAINHNQWAGLFFVVFVVIGSMFVSSYAEANRMCDVMLM